MHERHHLLEADFFRTGDIPLRVLRRNPQLPYPVHSHEFSEMVIITGGRGVHFTENGIFPVERGHVFVINGGDTHGYRDLNDLCLINLLFDLAKMAIPLMDLSQSTGFHTLFTVDPAFRRGKRSVGMLKADDENYRRLIGLVDSLEGALEADYPGSRFASLTSFTAILSLLTRIYDEQPFTEEYSYPHRLGAAFSYLDSNLDRIVMISELVEVAGISESSLLRGFKRITGCGPIAYHAKKRIERAAWLLVNTGMSVTNIAMDMGFDDPNYFSRTFRRMLGMAPREWRLRTAE